MFEDLLQRDDVLNFINEIKTNERYFDKNIDDLLNPSFYMSREIALYIFYDALFKYKIVLDDVYLFDEYLEQLEKLYRKIDNFNDIRFGINKLIGRMLSIKLDIKNINDDQSKKLLIETIYHKYIKNGYFFHGINSNYAKSILENGFTPEDYDNLYESFEQLNRIFAKYNIIRIIYKDFTSKQAYFTDDIVMGCYYSIYSPLFFYKFLTNEEYFGKLVQKDSYLIGDYSVLIKRLKRFMSNNLFHEDDRKSVLDIVQKQMNLLHSENKKICFVGDGNNVSNSLLLIAPLLGMDISLACPKGYEPKESILKIAEEYAEENSTEITITDDIAVALENVDVVYTDVWVSMGDEAEEKQRNLDFAPFQVNEDLMSLANDEVIDGPQSVIYDEAENRMHAQKAILYHYMKD